jgi:hypothetical protein
MWQVHSIKKIYHHCFYGGVQIFIKETEITQISGNNIVEKKYTYA